MTVGLAISGFKPELVLGPFYDRELPITKMLILYYTDHGKSISATEKIERKLRDFDILVHKVKIKNIFDFYEVYMNTLEMTKKFNISWVNETAGPGIAISSITLAMKDRKISYVYFHESAEGRPAYTDIIKSYNLEIFNKEKTKYMPIIKIIFNKTLITINDLSRLLSISESSISRKLSILSSMNFISSTGSGRGNSVKEFRLTETGKKVYSYYLQASESAKETKPE
jgi:DNA-binding MarR family transcriptional regulator